MKKNKYLLLLFTIIYLNINVLGIEKEKSAIEKLTTADFLKKVMNFEKNPSEWKYEGTTPCMVDFYADWCGPCRQAAPILEELAKKYEGKVLFYKVNIDNEKSVATIFGIQSIPAFLYVPSTGRPTMGNGIAGNTEATRAMFEKMINDILLK